MCGALLRSPELIRERVHPDGRILTAADFDLANGSGYSAPAKVSNEVLEPELAAICKRENRRPCALHHDFVE
jgi:hypothetical protein